MVQRPGEAADIPRDRHFIVVQDDDEIFPAGVGVVEPFKRNAAVQRAVSDHRDRLVRVRRGAERGRNTERGRNRGSGVPGHARVEFRLARMREAGASAESPQGAEEFPTPGQYLMRVGLMTDVEYERIGRDVENIMQRNGQLDRAEVGAEVAAVFADRVDDELPDLLRQCAERVRRKLFQVRRGIDLFQIHSA